MNKYAVSVICSFALASGCTSKTPGAKVAETAGVQNTAKKTRTPLPPDQRQMIDLNVSGLQGLAAESEAAAEDLNFLKQYSVPATYVNDVGIKAAPLPKSGPYFYLVADTRPIQMGIVGGFMVAPAPIVLLHNVTDMSVERPYVLAHELNHARSALIDGHRVLDRTDATGAFKPEFLTDEMLTYRHVSLIMDQATGGKWHQLVMQTVERRKIEAVKAGFQEDARGLGLVPGDVEAIRKLFPAPASETLEEFGLQLIVDAGLIAVENEAKKTGKRAFELEGMRLDFMANFYHTVERAFSLNH